MRKLLALLRLVAAVFALGGCRLRLPRRFRRFLGSRQRDLRVFHLPLAGRWRMALAGRPPAARVLIGSRDFALAEFFGVLRGTAS